MTVPKVLGDASPWKDAVLGDKDRSLLGRYDLYRIYIEFGNLDGSKGPLYRSDCYLAKISGLVPTILDDFPYGKSYTLREN